MSEETDQRRQYIEEALAHAKKHNDWCSPCVWWVCDFSKSPIEQRHVLALYDAFAAAERERDELAKQNLEIEANYLMERDKAEAAEREVERLRLVVDIANGIKGHLCSHICPTVWKTGTERPHDPTCSSLRAALAALPTPKAVENHETIL